MADKKVEVKKGDKVELDYSDLDKVTRKAFGNIPNVVKGVVNEISADSKTKEVWFTLLATAKDDKEEMYPVSRIVKLNGKKI